MEMSLNIFVFEDMLYLRGDFAEISAHTKWVVYALLSIAFSILFLFYNEGGDI